MPQGRPKVLRKTKSKVKFFTKNTKNQYYPFSANVPKSTQIVSYCTWKYPKVPKIIQNNLKVVSGFQELVLILFETDLEIIIIYEHVQDLNVLDAVNYCRYVFCMEISKQVNAQSFAIFTTKN